MATDVEKLAITEKNTIEVFLGIRQELRHMRKFFSFLTLKQQHLDALVNILETSDLQKNLLLLQRALLKNNICDLSSCETFINSHREGSVITIYQEMLTLFPRDQWLISCKLKSSSHVSTWHNTLAARSGADSLILNNQIIRTSDLKNETIVNQELRFLTEDEKLLGVFHIFGQNMLQCLNKIQFDLNGDSTNCDSLQTIPLPPDFSIDYQGKTIYKRHTAAHLDKIADNWLGDFNFDNLPKTVLDEIDQELSIYHPIIDNLILDEAGQVSVEKVSALTGGTMVIIFLFIAICLWKCPAIRGFLYDNSIKCGQGCYTCFTTKTIRLRRENKKIKKEMHLK